MANTQAVSTTFKRDLFNGLHAFGASVIRAATTKDEFYGALYFASASINATTTAYTATGEATGTNYSAGGQAITNATAPDISGTTAFWTPSAAYSISTLTMAEFDTLLIYNNTAAGKNAVANFNFGTQSITAGNLTLNMPTNDASTGLLRLA